MPYSSTQELPERVRGALDPSGQKTWMETFNSVWRNSSLSEDEREKKAFRVAWSRVDGKPVQNKAIGDIDTTPPKGARKAARKALRWREEHPEEIKGGTRVGWTRANQLAAGENLSEETISRMASFERHRKNAEVDDEHEGEPWKDAGRVAWLLWGGDTGISWAQDKVEEFKRARSTDNASAEDVKQQWVELFEVGEFVEHEGHPDGGFDVDREFARQYVDNFRQVYQSEGNSVPVWRGHEDEGFIYGEVFDLEIRNGHVMGHVEWADGVDKAVAQGRVRNLSPSFYPTFKHPHTGEVLENVPKEVSIVGEKHLKNIEPPRGTYEHDVAAEAQASEAVVIGSESNQQGSEMPKPQQTESTDKMTDETENMPGAEETDNMPREGGTDNADGTAEEGAEKGGLKATVKEAKSALEKLKTVASAFQAEELQSRIEDLGEEIAEIKERMSPNQNRQTENVADQVSTAVELGRRGLSEDEVRDALQMKANGMDAAYKRLVEACSQERGAVGNSGGVQKPIGTGESGLSGSDADKVEQLREQGYEGTELLQELKERFGDKAPAMLSANQEKRAVNA